MAEQTTEQEPAGTPQTYAEYYRQGWAHHAAGKQDTAEEYLRKAIELEPVSVDAHFALGLTLKAQDRRKEAIESFQKVISLVKSDDAKSDVRTEMIRRLAVGHINQVESGDWGLEGEIWRKQA